MAYPENCQMTMIPIDQRARSGFPSQFCASASNPIKRSSSLMGPEGV